MLYDQNSKAHETMTAKERVLRTFAFEKTDGFPSITVLMQVFTTVCVWNWG